MSTPILVTGATGTIGQALVKQLQSRGVNFAVMSSKPRREVSGLTTVQGDMTDVASLRTAFAGVDTMFLLFPFQANAVELARNAVQAAQAAGVKHIVRSSGAGADANSPVAIAQMQGSIDQLIEKSGIPYTLLRPNGFMQNWVNFSAGQIKAGAYAAPNGDGAISVIDVRDIAEVAAIVLTEPTTPESSTRSMVSTIESVTMTVGSPSSIPAIFSITGTSAPGRPLPDTDMFGSRMTF